jgi:hypothetical protein
MPDRRSQVVINVPVIQDFERLVYFSDFEAVPGYAPADFTMWAQSPSKSIRLLESSADSTTSWIGIETIGPGVVSADLPYQVTSEILLTKLTEGSDNDAPPGPYVLVGDTVTWTYLVENLGNEALANIAVLDDQPGVNPAPVLVGGFNVGDLNQNNLLEPGEVWEFTASGPPSRASTPTWARSQVPEPSASSSLTDDKPRPLFRYCAGSRPDQDGRVPGRERGRVRGRGRDDHVHVHGHQHGQCDVDQRDPGRLGGRRDDHGRPDPGAAVGAVDSTTFTGSYTITQADIDRHVPERGHGDGHSAGRPAGQRRRRPRRTVASEPGHRPDQDGRVPGRERRRVRGRGRDDHLHVHGHQHGECDVDQRDAGGLGGRRDDHGRSDPGTAVGAVDSTTFTGSYTITQADIDAGTFLNVATVTGTPPVGPPVSDDDDHDEPLPQNPAIDLIKTGVFQDENGDGYADVGETITYTFTVTNTGNVTLTNVTLVDSVGGVTITGGPIPVLPVGAVDSTTFTGSYTITQADIDAGHVFLNVATVTGTPPVGPPVSDDDDHDEPLPQFPAIDLIKTGVFQDENGDGYADVGETITYTFTVTNTGNVTLTNVTLVDSVGGVTITGGPIPVLPVGAVDSTTFTGSYTITQADIDAGTFLNVATVTGTPPVGPPVSDDDDHDEPLPQNPAIDLIKTGVFQDENGDGYADVGETITYTFTVTNTGNVTLTNVTLVDSVGGVTITGGPIPVLPVGAVDSTTFTGSYTITQADIDAGTFLNVATVTGTPPVGPPVSDDDDHDEPLPQNPAIDLIKTGVFQDENGDGYADVGETITYTFTVTNTGNVTLTNVTLVDSVGGVTITGGPIPVLPVGRWTARRSRAAIRSRKRTSMPGRS